jgi:2-polyprenyl-6-methoxyphenol hydroxylase-like FAD-dependent oxidoreductase
MDAGVIIVGAGPTGLMLAGEVYLAGVRPLVLEPQPRDTRSAVSIWTSRPRQIPRCRRRSFHNRDSSACSTNAPANSVPTYAADTRWSRQTRTTT